MGHSKSRIIGAHHHGHHFFHHHSKRHDHQYHQQYYNTHHEKNASGEIHLTHLHEFDENQIRLLRKTWKHFSSHKSEIGVKILLTFLEQQPSFKDMFQFRHIDSRDALVQHPAFQAHAAVFMQALEATIDHLDDLDSKVVPVLYDLGKQHTYFLHFRSDVFPDFADAMMAVWEHEMKDKFDQITSLTWRLFFTFLADTMQCGFRHALASRSDLNASEKREWKNELNLLISKSSNHIK